MLPKLIVLVTEEPFSIVIVSPGTTKFSTVTFISACFPFESKIVIVVSPSVFPVIFILFCSIMAVTLLSSAHFAVQEPFADRIAIILLSFTPP